MSNNQDRFTELYRQHYGDVYRFVVRRADAQQAGDIAHETFLTAWQRVAEIPFDTEGAKAWLYAVARNHLLHAYRASGRRTALSIRLAEDSPTPKTFSEPVTVGPDQTVPGCLDLSAAWSQLSNAEQEILTLLGWEELTITQAAAVLGISQPTVRLRLKKARSALRKALGESAASTTTNTVDIEKTILNSTPAKPSHFNRAILLGA